MRLRVVRRSPDGDRHAARGLELGRRVVGERHRHEVRRRRLGQVPGRRAQPVGLGGVGELAVRDAGPGLGHGEREVVVGLVGGLVVGGVPGERAVRLLDGPHLVLRRHVPAHAEPEVGPLGGRVVGLGRAGVGHLEDVLLVRLDRVLDQEVLVLAAVVRLLAVDRQRVDREHVVEVELDLVGVGRRPEGQPLGGQEGVGLRRPGQGELVVEGVDQRVADLGVDRVLAGLADRLVQDVAAPRCARASRGWRTRSAGSWTARRVGVVSAVLVAAARQGQDKHGCAGEATGGSGGAPNHHARFVMKSGVS